ncbi:MAG: hypothetical protein ACKVP2_17690 [Burkholderiales bacterium]
MKQRFFARTMLVFLGILLSCGTAWAAKAGMERFHFKRQNCQWTPEMGQFMYDCLKRGDGFGAHWCHNGAMDQFCPAEENASQEQGSDTGTEKLAEGTSKLERFHLRRGNCEWTPEMGQFIYECLKRGDGFGAHWCHNGAMDHFCPRQDVDTPAATPVADDGKG